MSDMERVMRGLAAGALAVLAACGGEDADAEARVPQAELRAPAGRPKPGVLPENTAARPASPCDWITAAEVEVVVGKLSGPPQSHEGGCFYPLPVDSLTIARRAKAKQVEEALARTGMKSDLPPMPGDTGGVLIHVSVGVGADERPGGTGFRDAGLLGPQRLAPGGTAAP
jgi:hypothetical protein